MSIRLNTNGMKLAAVLAVGFVVGGASAHAQTAPEARIIKIKMPRGCTMMWAPILPNPFVAEQTSISNERKFLVTVRPEALIKAASSASYFGVNNGDRGISFAREDALPAEHAGPIICGLHPSSLK